MRAIPSAQRYCYNQECFHQGFKNQTPDEVIIRNYRVCNEANQRLAVIPGLGVMSATAITAAIGDAKALTNGHQLAAWLGLVLGNHHAAGSNAYWESVNEAIAIRALR